MEKLLNGFELLSDSEKRVCQYIITNVKEVVSMNVYNVASQSFTSKTVVINTSKKLGFEGFTDLKYYLKQYLNESSETHVDVLPQKDFNDEILETTKMTCNLVGQNELEEAAHLIKESRVVYIAARGTSKAVADYLNHMLITIGIKAVLIDDYNLLSLVAERIDKKEVMILISLSGETLKIIDAAKKVKIRDAKLIAITSFTRNSLSKLSDINLFTASSKVDTVNHDSLSRIGMFVDVEILINKIKSMI